MVSIVSNSRGTNLSDSAANNRTVYDPKTGIYQSRVSDAIIPTGLSIFDLMFPATPTPTSTASPIGPTDPVWLIDSLTGRTLTKSQTLRRTLDVAKGLYGTYPGLGKETNGRRGAVVLFSGNEVDYATTLWAAFRLDSIVSCANPAYSAGELAFQIELVNRHHSIEVVVVHWTALETAKEAVEKAGLDQKMIVLISAIDTEAPSPLQRLASRYATLDDLISSQSETRIPSKRTYTAEESQRRIAFLSFSSGTTGLPKAVMIPHSSVVANVIQTAHHYSVTFPMIPYNSATKQGDVVIGCLPFYHIYGLIVVLHCSTYLNTPVVTLNKFTFPSFLETIQRHKVSILYIVPPMVIMLVKNALVDEYDLSSVRAGMTGAAPLSSETSVALGKKFPKWIFGQGYGMTETCTIISIFDPSRPIPGASAGVLAPNIRAKIVTPEGKLLGPGQVGELLSFSPSNAIGYLANEKATKETFESDGFVRTGDECYLDSFANLFVVDRLKELIKVKGNQVAPAELEGQLLEHPDVADVCVIGIPDDRAGERPKAYIALTSSALARIEKGGSSATASLVASLKKLVSDNKIAYKHIHEVEFIDAIPKTASGKLLRKDLRVKHAASIKGKASL